MNFLLPIYIWPIFRLLSNSFLVHECAPNGQGLVALLAMNIVQEAGNAPFLPFAGEILIPLFYGASGMFLRRRKIPL